MSPAGQSPPVIALYRHELLPWLLAGLALGLVEGGTAAVLVKQGFGAGVPVAAVNLAVAFVSGAPALSNVFSFLWANLAHGRARVRLLVAQLALFALLVGVTGLAPPGAAGLGFLVVAVLVARVLWSGILTVRAAVWTANYPRHSLARVTGRFVVATSLGVTAASAAAGLLLEIGPGLARWLYGGAAIAGLLAAWAYRRMRVRREFLLLRAERGAAEGGDVFSLRSFRQVLADDPAYRRFMGWLGLYGAGNLMINAQLVILFSDHLRLPAAMQIAIVSIVPLLCIPLFTPAWARLFDRGHVVEFRARQCWVLVAAVAVMILAVFTHWQPALWGGAVLLGISTAGANLGWNLGHSDFASLGRMQQYMGVHVTLTGLRGLLAPPVGVVAYQILESRGPGLGRYALFVPLAMTLAGAFGFNHMQGARASASPPEGRR